MANLVDQAPAMTGIRQRSIRWWALAGVPAVLGGVGGVAFLNPARSLATQDAGLRLCAAFGLVGVAALVVFSTGLRAYLDAQDPAGSAAGRVAEAGGLISAVTLFGAYLLKLVTASHTHLITGAADVVVRSGLDELTTGAWTALALTMLAVALAALRYGSLPRWLGWLSAAVGSLVAIAVIAGAPAAGYLPGAAWLLITSLALARYRKA